MLREPLAHGVTISGKAHVYLSGSPVHLGHFKQHLMSDRFPIETISDTALGVAFCRAIESERSDALFNDPFARTLAGERGAQIIRAAGGGPSAGAGIVARTCLIDRLILQKIAQGVDTVLNLGAGLDTRPYRLPLSESVHWIEVDLPAILSYKQQKLGNAHSGCLLERISLDLTDLDQRNHLFSRISTEASSVLVLTEGLLVYLTPKQAAALALDLHLQPNFRWWISDLTSPLTLKVMQLIWNRKLAAVNSMLQFAPQDATQFFQPYGWQVEQFHSFWQELHSLNRTIRFGRILRSLPIFQKDGVVLLEQINRLVYPTLTAP
jgi:methyltransferase (TIGR00027 family)